MERQVASCWFSISGPPAGKFALATSAADSVFRKPGLLPLTDT